MFLSFLWMYACLCWDLLCAVISLRSSRTSPLLQSYSWKADESAQQTCCCVDTVANDFVLACVVICLKQ